MGQASNRGGETSRNSPTPSRVTTHALAPMASALAIALRARLAAHRTTSTRTIPPPFPCPQVNLPRPASFHRPPAHHCNLPVAPPTHHRPTSNILSPPSDSLCPPTIFFSVTLCIALRVYSTTYCHLLSVALHQHFSASKSSPKQHKTWITAQFDCLESFYGHID